MKSDILQAHFFNSFSFCGALFPDRLKSFLKTLDLPQGNETCI